MYFWQKRAAMDERRNCDRQRLAEDPLLGLVGYRDRDRLLGRSGSAADHQFQNLDQVLLAERGEQDDFIQG